MNNVTSLEKSMLEILGLMSPEVVCENKDIEKTRSDTKERMMEIATYNYDFVNNSIYIMKKKNKHVFKSLSKKVEKKISKSKNIQPTFLTTDSNLLLGIYYVLGLESHTTCYFNSSEDNNSKNLQLWLKDIGFRIFYKKVLILAYFIAEHKEAFTFTKEELSIYTYLLTTNGGILFTYFLNNEKNITVEKVKSFFSKVYNWKTTTIKVYRTLSNEQEIILDQIQSGIRYEKIKDDTQRNNTSYVRRRVKYNVIDSMKNNITIKYLTKQEYKHRFHKRPIEHYRGPTVRHYKSGKVVHIPGMIINEGVA